jgi:hypothetical protein
MVYDPWGQNPKDPFFFTTPSGGILQIEDSIRKSHSILKEIFTVSRKYPLVTCIKMVYSCIPFRFLVRRGEKSGLDVVLFSEMEVCAYEN